MTTNMRGGGERKRGGRERGREGGREREIEMERRERETTQ